MHRGTTEQRGVAAEESTRDSLSESSSPRAQPPTDSPLPEDMFVRHKVSKLDTLAGLAIRYHVTVSDIKRANGLLSDSAMFARDTLLIPTKPLPVGSEYSTWAGMIVMQYGKLRSKDACPAGIKYKQLTARHTSIDELRGYYSTSPAGSSPNSTSGDEDEQRHSGGFWRNSREVELMERNTGGASSSYAEERLTRRRRHGDSSGAGGAGGGDGDGSPEGEQCSSPLSAAAAGLMALFQPFADLMEVGEPSRSGSGSSSLHSVRRPPGRRKESIFDRLKKVASQPALAVSAVPIGMVHAAEAVIRTARAGVGSSTSSGADPGHTRAQALQQAAYNLVAAPKESKKAD